jgi:ribosomal protein S25
MKASLSQSNHKGRGGRSKRPRNKDGSFRRRDRSGQDTRRSIIASWLEQEVVARRSFSHQSFAKMAATVVAVANGREPPLVPLPAGLKFPAKYTLSGRGAMAAFARYRARVNSNRADQENSNSNLDYELGKSSRAQMRRLDAEPLRRVRLQLRLRLRYRGLGSLLDLGTLDLGGLDLKGLEILQLQLWHQAGEEIETAGTKTTLRPDRIYAADPEFEEIRKALTPRELRQVERIWQRGRRRASARSHKREDKKSKAESLNRGIEVPPKAASASSRETKQPAGPVRSEELSHAANDQAAAARAKKANAQESQIEKEEIPVAQTPSSWEEGTVYRERILQYLRENSQEVWTTGQIATRLKISVPLALWALQTLAEERLIANLGSNQWQYIQPDDEKD